VKRSVDVGWGEAQVEVEECPHGLDDEGEYGQMVNAVWKLKEQGVEEKWIYHDWDEVWKEE
jgi:hypothetical protein